MNINFALILVPKAVYMDVPCSIILHRDDKQNDLCGFSCLTEAITLTLSNGFLHSFLLFYCQFCIFGLAPLAVIPDTNLRSGFVHSRYMEVVPKLET